MTTAPEGRVIFDGRLCSRDDAHIPATSPAALYGAGLFETLRTTRGALADADRHVERLKRSLEALSIPVPSAIEHVIPDTLRLVRLGHEDVVIRWTALQASASTSHLLIHARPLPPDLDERRAGTRCVLVPYVRELAGFKTTSWLGLSTLYRAYPHTEPLLVDGRGYVREGARTNLFSWDGATLTTPPLGQGTLLPGVARERLIQSAGRAGVGVNESPIHREELAEAAGLYLTNSVVGVARVSSVDAAQIPTPPLPFALAEIRTKLS